MKKNKSKKIKLIVTVSLIIVLAIWIGSIFINIKYISNWQTRGLFGDMFGSVNSLFSGLAFVGVILAIFLQSHELSLQRKELKKTQKVLRGQKQQLIIQNRTFTKQTFENTFFQLLNSHQILVESLNIFFVDQKFTGTRYFAHLYSDFRSTYKNLFLDNSNFEKHFPKVYNQFFKTNQSQLSHYFRQLYNILLFIDKSEVDDKIFYINLLRAKLSSNELLILFYNCISIYGKEKFKPLIESYNFLKYLPFEELLNKDHRNYYEDSAY
jgi:hypothetical protein